ncbi:MAG: FAD-dependent thymidylate synthase [Bacteroidales bacterium]
MKGISVKLVDVMGNDLRVVEAARATMGGESEVKSGRSPEALIKFLAEHKHVTPFRHPQVTFECEAPIAIARQLGKHQVGFQWNERSMRYRDTVIDVFIPEMFRGRPSKLSEGSTDEDVGGRVVIDHDPEWTIKDEFYRAVKSSVDSYEMLLEAGLSPEQARFVLPQGMITRWVWTGSLYGFFEVWRQRSSEHAQYEVREFANQVDLLMSELFPVSWQALKDAI